MRLLYFEAFQDLLLLRSWLPSTVLYSRFVVQNGDTGSSQGGSQRSGGLSLLPGNPVVPYRVRQQSLAPCIASGRKWNAATAVLYTRRRCCAQRNIVLEIPFGGGKEMSGPRECWSEKREANTGLSRYDWMVFLSTGTPLGAAFISPAALHLIR